MHEKSNGRVRQFCPDHLWNEHQMVIMYPNKIAWLVSFHDLVSNCLVDINIVTPRMLFIGFRRGDIWNLAMESRPQKLLAVSLIVSFSRSIGNVCRITVSLLDEPTRDSSFRTFGQIVCTKTKQTHRLIAISNTVGYGTV